MSSLSVIIITKNEEKNIRRCLASVAFADEIIVVDSGSTDKTVDIAREFTPHIHIMDWAGYGKQKNRALDLATKTWVLSLDADEEVSESLAKKIQAILKSDTTLNGFQIYRPVIFMEKLIRYASGADFTERLFRRGLARFTDVEVHETLNVQGSVGKLHEPIYHYSFGDVSVILNKMNKYTTLVAEQRAARGKRGSIFKAVTHALAMFFKVYFLKRGFLDGAPGFILSFSFAEGAYYRYVKLYCLNKNIK